MFVNPNTSTRGQIFINSVTLHANDAADVKGNDNYVTLLEGFIITPSLQLAQVNTKNVLGFTISLLSKSGVFHPREHSTQFFVSQHGVCTVLHLFLSRQFRTNNHLL